MINSSWIQILPESIRKRLDGRFSLQAIIANTGWLMVDKLNRIFIGLFVGAWVARYLGPEQFGELAYALALTAFFQALANLGLDGIVVRDIAREPKRSPEILGTTLRLRILSGFVSWLSAVMTVTLLRPGDSRSIILVALIACGIVFQAADTVDLWFQSKSQSRRTVLAKIATTFIANAIRVILILYQAPIEAFAAIQLLELVLGAIALMVAYRKLPSCDKWTGSLQTSKVLAHEAWPLLLGGISVVIYMRINQIMLREMVGEHELGVFSAVLPFSEAWNVIPMAICTSIAPVIARKRLENDAAYYESLQILFNMLAWFSLIIALVIIVLSSFIVNVFLGPKYSESIPVLMILILASMPIFLGVAQGIWIINEHKSRLALIKAALGAMSSILFNILLIPIYGAKGAAAATVISQFVSAVFSNFILAPNIFKMQLQSYRISFKYGNQ